MFEQVIPAARGVADSEVISRGAIEAAIHQEPAANFRLRARQLLGIKLSGNLVGLKEALAPTRLFAGARRAAFFIAQLQPDAAREVFHRFHERQVVHFLEETDDVDALNARSEERRVGMELLLIS